MTDAGIPSLPERLKGWLSLAGVIAVIFYAVLRLAYLQFYQRLGLKPEDVGLGKTELLTQSLVGPAVFFLMLAGVLVLFVVAFVPYLLLGSLYQDLAKRLYQRAIARSTPERRAAEEKKWAKMFPFFDLTSPPTPFKERLRKLFGVFKTWAPRVIFVASVLSFVWTSYELYRNAGQAARDARKGQNIQSVPFPLFRIEVPLLEVRAAPVAVNWKGETTPLYLKDAIGCLMYLGESGDKVVLFNLRDDSVVRFSAGDALLSISRHDDVEATCE